MKYTKYCWSFRLKINIVLRLLFYFSNLYFAYFSIGTKFNPVIDKIVFKFFFNKSKHFIDILIMIYSTLQYFIHFWLINNIYWESRHILGAGISQWNKQALSWPSGNLSYEWFSHEKAFAFPNSFHYVFKLVPIA